MWRDVLFWIGVALNLAGLGYLPGKALGYWWAMQDGAELFPRHRDEIVKTYKKKITISLVALGLVVLVSGLLCFPKLADVFL